MAAKRVARELAAKPVTRGAGHLAYTVLAKKLRHAVIGRIRLENDVGEVETLALLLTTEILGPRR